MENASSDARTPGIGMANEPTIDPRDRLSVSERTRQQILLWRSTLTRFVGAVAPSLLAALRSFPFFLYLPSPALADSTHKYLFSFDTPPGTKPMPTAVDSEGNLYVYNEGTNTVSKYHPDLQNHPLTPVNFSALGTNTIDGHGFGEDCPATPDDCDRVPSNGLGSSPNPGKVGTASRGRVQMDNSNGPAHGYIYVTNPAGGPGESAER